MDDFLQTTLRETDYRDAKTSPGAGMDPVATAQ